MDLLELSKIYCLHTKIDNVWNKGGTIGDQANSLINVMLTESSDDVPNVITITPLKANANFRIYSDREVKRSL